MSTEWYSDLDSRGSIKSNSATKSVQAGILTSLSNVWLNPGTYLLIGLGIFGYDGSTRRKVSVSIGGTTKIGYDVDTYGPGVTQKISTFTISENSNIVLSVQQDSGAVQSITGEIYAIQIKWLFEEYNKLTIHI